ncbi:hypothetical protein C5167_028936 [Papaver somniferum]|nr:hypothetical protein C5167_028936 [Papaver somniferum]
MDPPWSPTPPPPPSTLDAPFLTSAPRHEQSCCGFLPLCLWFCCFCGIFRSFPPLFERPAPPTLF